MPFAETKRLSVYLRVLMGSLLILTVAAVWKCYSLGAPYRLEQELIKKLRDADARISISDGCPDVVPKWIYKSYPIFDRANSVSFLFKPIPRELVAE